MGETRITAVSIGVWLGLAPAAAWLLGAPALAQAPDAVEKFYAGRSIDLLVGAGVGGSYDAYARLLARHWPRYIPGHPAVNVKVQGGVGGGIQTTIQLDKTAPKDGTVVGMTQQTNIVSQLTENVAIGKYDVRKWRWIGLIAPVRDMLAVWHTAPAQTLEEAKQTVDVIGATGRSSPTFSVPQTLNEMIGTKFKIVVGYSGTSDLNLAMERGEIQGRGASWQDVISRAPQYISEKKLKPLVVEGLTREPTLPDVPLITDLARTDEQRAATRLMASSAEFGRSVFCPPGTPDDRVQALRRAFDQAVRDPDFLAEAKEQRLAIEPRRGEDLQAIADDVIGSSSPQAIADAKTLLGSD